MKRINILCPGPSLKVCSPEPADLTIAVNGAIEFPAEIEWWAAYDREVFAKFDARPTVGVIASFERPLLPREFQIFDKLYWADLPHPNGVENAYTVLLALAAASTKLKGNEVHLYGCDMTGVLDYNGNRPEAYGRKDGDEARGESRWSRERTALKRFIEFYESEYNTKTVIHNESGVISKG